MGLNDRGLGCFCSFCTQYNWLFQMCVIHKPGHQWCRIISIQIYLTYPIFCYLKVTVDHIVIFFLILWLVLDPYVKHGQRIFLPNKCLSVNSSSYVQSPPSRIVTVLFFVWIIKDSCCMAALMESALDNIECFRLKLIWSSLNLLAQGFYCWCRGHVITPK